MNFMRSATAPDTIVAVEIAKTNCKTTARSALDQARYCTLADMWHILIAQMHQCCDG